MHPGISTTDDTVELTPTPPDRRVPERPVFVDASGRRQQRVRRIGRILVVPAVAYVGLLTSTLLGGPTINIPFLPLPSAPHSSGDQGTSRTVHHGTSGGTNGGSTAGANGTGTNAGLGVTAGVTAGTGSTAGTGVQSSPGTTAGTTGTSAAPSALPSVTTSPSAGITHGHSRHTAVPPGASHHPTKKAIPTAS